MSGNDQSRKAWRKMVEDSYAKKREAYRRHNDERTGFVLIILGFLFILLVAALGSLAGCATWRANTERAVFHVVNKAEGAAIIANEMCRPVLDTCIREKDNPCPALDKCVRARIKVQTALASVQGAAIAALRAVRVSDEPKATLAIQQAIATYKNAADIMAAWGMEAPR